MSTKTETRRVAVVTGCSEPASLGAAFCLELQSRDYRVFATARKLETMKGLKDKGIETLTLDVTDAESIREAVDTVSARAGRLDMLVNNAGVASTASALNTDMERYKDMLAVNTIGPAATIQAFAPLLIATANSSKSGSVPPLILNIGSTACWGNPWHSAYSASKAALHSYSDALRWEVKGLGLNVTTGYFGSIPTPMAALQKPFPLTKSDKDPYYPNYEEIRAEQIKQLAEFGKSSPNASRVAKDVMNTVEGKKNPPARVYAGGGASLAPWYDYLPGWVKTKIWTDIGALNLIQRPRKSD